MLLISNTCCYSVSSRERDPIKRMSERVEAFDYFKSQMSQKLKKSLRERKLYVNFKYTCIIRIVHCVHLEILIINEQYFNIIIIYIYVI